MVMRYVFPMDNVPHIAFCFDTNAPHRARDTLIPRFYFVLPGNHTSIAFEPIACGRDVFNALGPMPASYDDADLSIDGLLNFTRVYLNNLFNTPALPEVHILFVDARSEVFQLPRVEVLAKLSQFLGTKLLEAFNQFQSSYTQWSLSEWASAHEEVFGKLESSCG